VTIKHCRTHSNTQPPRTECIRNRRRRHHRGTGKGYASEATTLIVDYPFLTRNIVRVQADANADNRASQRVFEKAGFTREGVLPQVYFEQDAWRDAVLYSIIRDEWNALTFSGDLTPDIAGPKALTERCVDGRTGKKWRGASRPRVGFGILFWEKAYKMDGWPV
jgi:hypothetical protein